ncbi:MAG: hypothetical protein ACK55I_48985, partial [bacterium]
VDGFVILTSLPIVNARRTVASGISAGSGTTTPSPVVSVQQFQGDVVLIAASPQERPTAKIIYNAHSEERDRCPTCEQTSVNQRRRFAICILKRSIPQLLSLRDL